VQEEGELGKAESGKRKGNAWTNDDGSFLSFDLDGRFFVEISGFFQFGR